jgi:hypothetical protein
VRNRSSRCAFVCSRSFLLGTFPPDWIGSDWRRDFIWRDKFQDDDVQNGKERKIHSRWWGRIRRHFAEW